LPVEISPAVPSSSCCTKQDHGLRKIRIDEAAPRYQILPFPESRARGPLAREEWKAAARPSPPSPSAPQPRDPQQARWPKTEVRVGAAWFDFIPFRCPLYFALACSILARMKLVPSLCCSLASLRSRPPSNPGRPCRIIWSPTGPSCPKLESGETSGVAVDQKDNVWVFNRGAHPVIEFDREGNFIQSWGDNSMIKSSHGIRIDPDGNVWCVDVATTWS